MKIRKQALIDAIDSAISDHQAATERYASALEYRRRQLADEWSAEALSQWRALRDHLTKAIKSGNTDLFTETAIRNASVGNSTGSLPYYYPSYAKQLEHDSYIVVDGTRVDKPRGVDVTRLQALKAALNAIVEDELSDTQLSRMGFSTPGWIFTAAVANSGGAK